MKPRKPKSTRGDAVSINGKKVTPLSKLSAELALHENVKKALHPDPDEEAKQDSRFRDLFLRTIEESHAQAPKDL